MKKVILLTAVILLSATTFAQAQDGLTGTVDLTYLSQYIWRGFELYGNQSAIQPSSGQGPIQADTNLKRNWTSPYLTVTLSMNTKLMPLTTRLAGCIIISRMVPGHLGP